MGLRLTNLSPAFRLAAAFALVIYFAAQTVCFIHCTSGGLRASSTSTACHGNACAAGHAQGTDSAPPPPSTTPVCFTLMNSLVTSDSPTLVIPEFSAVDLVISYALACEVMAPEPKILITRQANRDDWVFTPELSLGPAFRSLAPPSVS